MGWQATIAVYSSQDQGIKKGDREAVMRYNEMSTVKYILTALY